MIISKTRPRRRLIAATAVTTAVAAALAGIVIAPTAPQALAAPATTDQLQLRYDEPASKGEMMGGGGAFGTTAENNMWQQRTLPVGNGNLGMNVYGEIATERLSFNEKTLWTGGPSESRPDYNGGNIEAKGREGAALREIQQAFTEGRAADARATANRDLVGTATGYGAYEGYAEINLDFGLDQAAATGYERTLDLETGTATVKFTIGGVTYKREYFTSYPDNVVVMRLTASESNKLDVGLGFNFRHAGSKTTVTDGTITVSGALSDNQLKHNAVMTAVPKGGSLKADGERVQVVGADSVLVYLSAGTDYADSYPTYRTGQSDADLAAQVRGRVDLAVESGYKNVRSRHLADYQELFDRVDMSLGELIDAPTDDLLKKYRDGGASNEEKRTLETLLYQYGRYLGISSSREGTLPANLQGVWNDRYSGGPSAVPWGSDYHMNVNLQMNYWPAYSGNLAETATPLVDYVDGLREPGRETARVYAGVASTAENPENGFTAHTQNTPFGWTTPGWSFSWGWSPGAVPWILQNVFEYYEFTGDETYLRDTIYPMLKEAAKYYDQTLVEHAATGRLVTSPAYSPEHGPISDGNFYEQQLVWQLYQDAAKSADLLGIDAELAEQWRERQALLKPVEVGESGQIKEWFDETTLGSIPGTERAHRHISHMLGLFPGDLITPDQPELIEAAKVSMNDRGDNATGWGIAQRINTWARIGDGDRSLKIIEQLFRTGIYPNLFDSHPPFQIDGNFGYTSAVNEMLVQSNAGYVNLLPALPSGWSDGSMDGIIARGDFEIGLEWAEGRATSATVTSRSGGELVLNYPGISGATVQTASGAAVEITAVDSDRISAPTSRGETYVISDIPGEGEFAQAPTGGEALRSAAEQVTVTWKAISGLTDATYTVERKVAGGEFETLATGLTVPLFVDEEAPDSAGTYSYRVATVLNGITSKPGNPISVEDVRGTGIIDDRDGRVKYEGSWGTWNDPKHHNGTIKFLQTSTGGEKISLRFAGTGVSFISPKNTTYGSVDFYIDGEKVTEEPYSLYSPTDVSKQEVVVAEGLTPGIHTVEVVATGVKPPGSAGTKLEFDAFRVVDGDDGLVAEKSEEEKEEGAQAGRTEDEQPVEQL